MSDDGSTSSDERDLNCSAEEGSEQGGTDGFANVLNKILSQDIGNKNPVLAKRKTQIMKEQEAHKLSEAAEKRRRLANKANRERQMKVPGVASIDYERQLRKVATRGVIALFNAIFQAKKEAEVTEDEPKSYSGGAGKAVNRSATDIKQLTQEKFLEMLKSGKKTSSATSAAHDLPAEGSHLGAKESTGWNAIKDDYMLGKKISMKDWDKEEDSDEANEYSDDDNFEEILDEADKKARERKGAVSRGGMPKKRARR